MGGQRSQVRGRRVALVRVEAVLRPVLVQGDHRAVAGDLGEDRGGHDRAVAGVTADPGLGRAGQAARQGVAVDARSEEHTSELQSLMRTSYAVFCLKKKKNNQTNTHSSN